MAQLGTSDVFYHVSCICFSFSYSFNNLCMKGIADFLYLSVFAVFTMNISFFLKSISWTFSLCLNKLEIIGLVLHLIANLSDKLFLLSSNESKFYISKVKSVKWEKCWSGRCPIRVTFHNPLLCFNGFPWTPSIAVWRVFWPSMHMMWQLGERITDPASLRAGCRKVFLLHSDVYFSAVLHFSVVLYLFNFVVNMEYRSQSG